MKKHFFTLCVLLCGSLAALAQCDKPLVLTSSKTEYLDASLAVQRTVEEATTIEITDSTLTITPGHEGKKMTGTITAKTCNWTTAYKEGKSVYKTMLKDESGDAKNLTITLEGKGGNVHLLAEVDEMQNQKIRVAADTFREKK